MMSTRETKGNPNRQTMEEIVSGKKEEPSATDDDPDPAEWVKSSYTYDVTAPYYEVLTETTNDVTTAYDNGVERLSSYTGASAWNTIKTQYVYDGRGSVAQELSNNNSWYTFGGALSKTAKTSYSYTPFGELLKNESSGFRFNHEYYEAATGMLNLRARQYEPAIVRFNQRDIWHGKVEMPTSQNRYLYCVNDPIGYYDRSGNRVDEDVGKPKKETTSRIASAVKKLNTTMSNVANLVDTTMIKATNTFKNNVSDAAERVGNWLNKNSKTIAQVAIGVMTVAACVGIVAASGGLAAPALGAAAPGFLETFGLNVLLGTTLTYGDNLIKQVDRNGTFIQANEKASLATRHALPYIIAGSAAGAGVAKYASTLTGGGLRPLGLKDTPFPTKALDELLGDSSSTYAGTQAAGATQSGSAGTTACTAEQITGEWHHIASDKSLVSGYTAQYEKIFKNAGMTLQDNENLMFLQNHSGAHTVAYKQYVLDYIEYATKGLSGSAAKEALTSALGQLKDQLIANPLMPYRGGMN